MTTNVSRATVEAFYAAYAAHDADRLTALMHDDIEWTVSGPVDVLSWCGVHRGKAAVLDMVGCGRPGQMQVISLTRSSLLVDGNEAASLNRLTACRHGDERVISYRLAHFMRFQDDKLISNMSLIDSFDAVEQVLGHPIAVDGPPAGLMIGEGDNRVAL
jgi:ketosteroid isomerase-like protein